MDNTLTETAARILKYAVDLQVGASDENPASSWRWKFPAIVDLRVKHMAYSVVFPFCAYGTP